MKKLENLQSAELKITHFRHNSTENSALKDDFGLLYWNSLMTALTYQWII